MYHFWVSMISGGLPLASSQPSTANFWLEPFSIRMAGVMRPAGDPLAVVLLDEYAADAVVP